MIERRYADRTPLLGPVYCDASFLLDLYTASGAPTANFMALNPFVRARATAAVAFQVWAQASGIGLCTSLLGVQECYHKMLFSNIKAGAGKAGHRTWKDWRANDPAAFKLAMRQGRGALHNFHAFFQRSGIMLLSFGPITSIGVLPRDPRIVGYARAVLVRYDADTMDAFHYALMRVRGISTAASSDADWVSFPWGTVVTA